MKMRACALACCLAGSVAVVFAATMQKIVLSDGYDDVTRIASPVYQSSGLSVELVVKGSPASKAKFVRRTGGRLPATRGPEYDLDPNVDLSALLTQALASEAQAMGLVRSGTSDRPWHVAGTLKDVFMESRQIYMGSTLFYGYLDVEFSVASPSGENSVRRLRLHSYSGSYNAGFGRRDEAEASAAHLLVEGAQEILARLNREFFKVAPHADMSSRLARLQSAGVKGNLADLRMVGLSGLPAAVPALVGLLKTEKDEDLRASIVNSLAHLGSQDAVAVLAERYSTEEDEDVRWYSLKAMDYIGGSEAARVVSTVGANDEDAATKRLAARIAAPAR